MKATTTDDLRRIVAAHAVCAVCAIAPRASADCATAARSELKHFGISTIVQRATLGEAELVQGTCTDDKPCRIVTFAAGTKPTTTPQAPEGFVAADGGWTAVGLVASAPDCADLFEYVLEKAPKAAPVKAGHEDKSPKKDQRLKLSNASSADAALEAFRKAPRAFTTLNTPGRGQISAQDMAAETLQILGQIVVDRASSKGYALVTSKLEAQLDCASSTTLFPATCAVLEAVRLQDVAMAPQALAQALALDMLKLLASRVGLPKIEAATAVPATSAAAPVLAQLAEPLTAAPAPKTPEQVLKDSLVAVAVSLATQSAAAEELAVRRAVAALADYVAAQPKLSSLSPAQQAAVYGMLGLARCREVSDGTSGGLASCDVEAQLSSLNTPEPVKPAAFGLAEQLILVVSAPRTDTVRVRLALDTAAQTGCMILQGEQSPVLACPQIETITTLDNLTLVAFVDALADALLAKDPARFTVVAAKVVDLVWATKQDQREKRSALRLLAGLLDYAATYAQPADGTSGAVANDAHEQRTKILESLTKDMSDRTGRTGDTVFSLSGALRFTGGVRVATQGTGATFWGPIGLPLGVALTHISEDGEDGWGFHLQADAIDLGNYLSLDNGPKVAKPSLGDAFAPGLSIGAAYGASMPFVITASGSYTPHFVLNPDHPDKHGAVNFGLTFGIHVPLIDLN